MTGLTVALGGLIASPGADAAPVQLPTGPASATGTTMVTTGDVNLRSEPNTDSAIVKVLAKGTTVTTTGTTSGRFVQVVVNGAKNWVSGLYLTPTPTPDPPVERDVPGHHHR
ncbi:MAG: SH3 domain-containing protein [Micropruina sp.]